MWIVLTSKWKREDVQAVLNVVISLVCFVAVFTSARYFWQTNAIRVTRRKNVPLASLITFTSLGEVVDVTKLFKSRLLTTQHLAIFIQCIVVVFFSVSAILAGPIANISTRYANMTDSQPVPGLLASISSHCDLKNNVQWQKAMDRLDSANFPLDQLLDFMPNIDTDWVYQEKEWNNTYGMTCSYKDQTDATLEAVGFPNGTKDNLLWTWDNFDGLLNVLPERFHETNFTTTDWSGFKNYSSGQWNHVLLWIVSAIEPDVLTYNETENMAISITSLYMEGVPIAENANFDFGVGPIARSFYTQMECDIKRKNTGVYSLYEAFPGTVPTLSCIGSNLPDQFSANAVRPTQSGGQSVNLPTGQDLVRWYQAYTIVKDSYQPIPGQRQIAVRFEVVEIHAGFLAALGLCIILIAIGTARYFIYSALHPRASTGIPETKVDWILQSLQESHAAHTAPTAPNGHASAHRPTGFEYGKNVAIESAMYGAPDSDSQNARDQSTKSFGKVIPANARVATTTALVGPGEGESSTGMYTVPSQNYQMHQMEAYEKYRPNSYMTMRPVPAYQVTETPASADYNTNAMSGTYYPSPPQQQYGYGR